MTNPATAVDEMFTLLNTYWLTTGYQMVWPNTATGSDSPATGDEPWGRTTVHHSTGGQASLHENPQYDAGGILIIEIFIVFGEGNEQLYTLCKSVLDVFRNVSTASGVWFSKQRILASEQDGRWFKANVVIEFEYTERKA